MGARPPNIGILAMEAYVPLSSVHAPDLEQQDGVPGKYTKGLGQISLSFCNDREDVVSMAMTATHFLLEKYEVDPRRIGRLEVGSESGPDRSKSIKSYLMQLFGAVGNNDIEGVDSVHGCYGATAALFNSINWIESSGWDGRFALVVATDMALYPAGSAARLTGGAGAVALLLGPDAPLVLDSVWHATFADHSSDFCKPVNSGPYPTFDSAGTVFHYLRAADITFMNLHRRLQHLQNGILALQAKGNKDVVSWCDISTGLFSHVSFFLAHAPYARLVRKAFARMAFQDALRNPHGSAVLEAAGVPARWQMCDPDALAGAGYADKALESSLLTCSSQAYDEKVQPGVSCQQRIGNTYTASVYMGLAGLVESQAGALNGRRILLFSFGSGVMASLFSLVGRAVQRGNFTLERIASNLGLNTRLNNQAKRHPYEYDYVLEQAKLSWSAAPFKPTFDLSTLSPGTWFLDEVKEDHSRVYHRCGHFNACPTPLSSSSAS